jgi:Protein of unknown function (DUF1203)
MSIVMRTLREIGLNCAVRPAGPRRRIDRTAGTRPVPRDNAGRCGRREASDFRQPSTAGGTIVSGTTLSTATFTVRPIDRDVVDRLRRIDDAGREPRDLVAADGGSPLRCCLHLSRPGERLLLAAYAPLRRWAAATGAAPGAYDEIGPVFLHAEPCDDPTSEGWPPELRDAPRVLRGYGADGRIVDGRVVGEGEAPEPAIDELLADERVAVVHARALVFGCFTFAIDRVSPA